MSLESIQNFCYKENFSGNTHIECIPVSWIEDFPEYYQDGHNFSQSITLKLGKAWLLFPCVPDTIDFRERERSGNHGILDTPTISGFVPGDTPKIASVLNSAKANEWVVILYYKTGEAKVIGSPENPARFSSSLNNRGTLSSGKGYDIEFYSEGSYKTFFLGELPDEVDNQCLPGVLRILDRNNVLIDEVEVSSGGSNIYNVIDLPCPAPQAGTVEIIDSQSNLIGTINVASGETETFEVLDLPCPAPQDGTVEVIDSESNLIGTINVASGGNEIFEVLDLPYPKDVTSYIPYKAGDDFIEIEARPSNAGVISNIVTSGLSGVTTRMNGNPFFLPTNWNTGDVLRIEFNSASADGEIQIIGSYA